MFIVEKIAPSNTDRAQIQNRFYVQKASYQDENFMGQHGKQFFFAAAQAVGHLCKWPSGLLIFVHDGLEILCEATTAVAAAFFFASLGFPFHHLSLPCP